MSKLLKVPLEQVRVVWASDAGSYGRAALEESAAAAALLSRAIDRPVRVQSMRADNTQWGNKAPAIAGRMRATLKNGSIVAFDAQLRQFNGNEIFSQPSIAGSFIAGQMAGFPNDAVVYEFGQYGDGSGKYEIPNFRASAEVIAPFTPGNSPLRTAHMRDPEGPSTSFLIESFMDELAAHAGMDAVAHVPPQASQRPAPPGGRAAGGRSGANWQARPLGVLKHTATQRRTDRTRHCVRNPRADDRCDRGRKSASIRRPERSAFAG